MAITDTPRQTDLDRRREKFEGTIVYTTTIPNTAETVQEQIDGQWYVAWSVSVPISIYFISITLIVEHGRTRITNPRVALTAILSLSPTTVENHEPKDEVITAESWKFLSGQTNLLAPLANDPTTTVDPVLPLSRIISAGPTHANRTKPGRRICRHIFPCGSPLDIRMRYNPLEPDDNNIASAEIVLLSVDLSVTPHANASVLVKNIKVEMGGGTIAPLQDVKEATLRRYDVLTLLYRYERYGGDGGRKTVSTSATMIPLLSNSAETSPQITSLWNKVLDIPNLNPLSQMAAPTQRAVSQILTPPNSARHSPKPSTGKPRTAPTHGRAQTVIDLPTRPVPSVASISFEPPNLSITVQVPSSGVKPNEEFPVEIQLVNRAYRPMKLALHVDSGQAHFRTQSRATRMDKLLPRVPMSATLAQPTEPERNNVMTEAEVRGYFLREHELRKGKPIIALTVEGKIGYGSLASADVDG